MYHRPPVVCVWTEIYMSDKYWFYYPRWVSCTTYVKFSLMPVTHMWGNEWYSAMEGLIMKCSLQFWPNTTIQTLELPESRVKFVMGMSMLSLIINTLHVQKNCLSSCWNYRHLIRYILLKYVMCWQDRLENYKSPLTWCARRKNIPIICLGDKVQFLLEVKPSGQQYV